VSSSDASESQPAPRRTPRYSLSAFLALISAAALGIGWAASASRWEDERANLLALIPKNGDAPNNHVLETRQITIAMCSDAGLSPNDWELSVNSDGQAVLLSEPYAKPPVSHNFQLSDEQQQRIRKLLISERFFELKNDYGDLVPDAPSQTLTIVIGGYSKTVALNYLRWDPNDPNYNAAHLQEAARALRVYLAIRDCFPASTVSDERPYLRRALQAAEKLPPTAKQ
jgi:hypothetical protein